MAFWFIPVGLLLALVGFLILLVTQARLVWEELTPQELEALRQAVRSAPEAEMVFHGTEGVLSSRWNWLASRLFPGVLLIDVKINDQDVTLVVDSGVLAEEFLLLYADRARAVDARLIAEAPPIHPPERGRQFPSFRGVVNRLELGELVVERALVRVVAARHRLKALGLSLFQVEGFVGLSFLKQFAATWDLEHHRLHLQRQVIERPGLAAPLQQAEFESEGERVRFYYVEGFLNGDPRPYRLLIDTGASTPVLLVSGQIAQAYGEGRGRFRIKRLKLGEIELEDLPAINLEVILGGKLPKGSIDVILGAGLLKAKGFKRLTLDFLAGKLYAER